MHLQIREAPSRAQNRIRSPTSPQMRTPHRASLTGGQGRVRLCQNASNPMAFPVSCSRVVGSRHQVVGAALASPGTTAESHRKLHSSHACTQCRRGLRSLSWKREPVHRRFGSDQHHSPGLAPLGTASRLAASDGCLHCARRCPRESDRPSHVRIRSRFLRDSRIPDFQSRRHVHHDRRHPHRDSDSIWR